MVAGRELTSVTLAKRWACVFESRSGGRARALFATQDQARHFAEQHALAFSPAGTKFNWAEAGDSSVLTTQVGKYVVARIAESGGRSRSD
jgi:hypothetical protein